MYKIKEGISKLLIYLGDSLRTYGEVMGEANFGRYFLHEDSQQKDTNKTEEDKPSSEERSLDDITIKQIKKNGRKLREIIMESFEPCRRPTGDELNIILD